VINNYNNVQFIIHIHEHSFIHAISIAHPQVHYFSVALPTQHGYCVGVSCQSATGNCEWRTFPMWWPERDLNPRPLDERPRNYQRATTPYEHIFKIFIPN